MTKNTILKEAFSLSEASITAQTVTYLINKIYDDFENRKCKNCKWLKDEVCTNSDSIMCAYYPVLEMCCSKWEKK